MLKSVFTYREILRFRSGWMNKLQENVAKNRKHQERVRKQRDFERVSLECLLIIIKITYRFYKISNVQNFNRTKFQLYKISVV